MRIVAQRVLSADCVVDGKMVSSIGRGLVCFVGIGVNDGAAEVEKCVDKIGLLRVFEDENCKMSLSCDAVGGEFLLIPNFTLYGSLRHGKRPDFTAAAASARGRELFEEFVRRMASEHRVCTGVFGGDMKVTAVNDGPITIIFDTDNL